MKLHQLIIEAQGPVSVKMTLAEIINAGKVTNPYQLFVLAWLSEFFKNGLKTASLHLEMPITFDSQATSTTVVTLLKNMAPEQHVELAQYLSDCVDAGESLLANPSRTCEEWISFVLSRQD